MKKIVLLSDTHGYLDQAILKNIEGSDEIWHAGDFGPDVSARLSETGILRGVSGNIDGTDIRMWHPQHLVFDCEGLKVYMTHIGGYPGSYSPAARLKIEEEKPGLFVSGHSHILKVMPDKKYNLLHMNPGAAGKHGFHKIRTMLKFSIAGGRVSDLVAIELGLRGEI